MTLSNTAAIKALQISSAAVEARLDGFEVRFDAKMDAILAALNPGSVAKTAPAVEKAPSAAKPQVRATSTTGKALCKATRLAFLKAAAKEGTSFPADMVNGREVNWSTKEIARWCVENSYAPKGFRIGEGYTAMYS